MKKLILSAFLLCSCTMGFAQLLSVESIEKLPLPDGTTADVATFSPNGKYLLFADKQKQGLLKYDLQSQSLSTLSKAPGAGYDVKISADGQTVVYRETQFGKDKLKKTSVKAIDLASGKVQTIVKPTRNLQAVALDNGTVLSVTSNKLKSKTISKASAAKGMPVVSVRYGQLMLTRDGKTTTLSPNGTSGQSYLWPSISPDGTKIVYYLATQGTYVCNIDGTNPVRIGLLRAPKWLNNNIVIGMHDRDNGEQVTSSAIVAASIDGKATQTLTDSSVMAMYPTATASADRIAFTTPSGAAYIINVTLK